MSGWLLSGSISDLRRTASPVLPFLSVCPHPRAGDGNADGRGRGGAGETRGTSIQARPCSEEALLTHAVCSFIRVHLRESSQVFNETSQCEQGLRKTLSCFATTLPLALLCSTTPSLQDTLPRLLRCPICVGILGTHVLVASYKFLWSKQSGPVSPQKPSSQLAVI